jgi:hypothetical protein
LGLVGLVALERLAMGGQGCRFASSHQHQRRFLHVMRMRMEWIKQEQRREHQAAPAELLAPAPAHKAIVSCAFAFCKYSYMA